MEQINALFTNLLNITTGVAVAVAACFLAWGAIVYMTAGGSPRQMESGKQAITNAIIGLVIVLSAFVIAKLINSALGGS